MSSAPPPKRQRTTTEDGGTHTQTAKKKQPTVVVAGPRKPATVRSIAEKALALAKLSQAEIERKNSDIASNVTVGTTAGTIHITALTQGIAANNRIGQEVNVTGLAMNYYWYKHPSSVVTNIRFVIVQDTQTVSDATSVSWTDVFASSSNIAQITRTGMKGRFKILYDNSAILDASEISGRHNRIFIPLKLKIQYNGTASTDIQKNALYGLVLSDDNTNQPAFNYFIRMYFTDQ